MEKNYYLKTGKTLLSTLVFFMALCTMGYAQGSFDIALGSSSATCEISSDGTAYVISQSGGVEPITYAWNDGQTFVVAYDLPAGTYSVTATDAVGATATGSVEVGLSPESVWLMPVVTNGTCGDCNGTIDPMAMLGLPPYSYAWSNGQTGAIATGLCAGTYTVTVSDSQGCANSTTAVVEDVTTDDCNNPNPCVASAASITTNDPTVICADDDVADMIDVAVSGGSGTNTAWVITDDAGNILALPASPPFDLEGAGGGTCLIWYLTFEDGLMGAAVGNNANQLDGCFALSNSIAVIRNVGDNAPCASDPGPSCDASAASITTNDPTVICADDNVADMIDVAVSGGSGTNTAWVITDDAGNILALPASPPFDLEGAGGGTCLIWYLSYENGLMGAAVGNNANQLDGCFALSNSIAVIRNVGDNAPCASDPGPCDVTAATISTDNPTTICIGDGTPDPITIGIQGASSDDSIWLITDESGMILATPGGPVFDLEGAVPGICNIYYVAYSGELEGAIIGGNVNNLDGCHAVSNSVTVTRNQAPTVNITPSDAYLCRGESIQMIGSATGLDLTYAWSATGGSFGDATSANTSYTMMMPGTYTLTLDVTEANGCTTSNTTTVTVVDVDLNLNVTEISACGNSDGAITATATGSSSLTYAWNTGETGTTISGLSEGIYSVTVTDGDSGCFAEAIVTLSDGGIDIGDYVWYDNNENCTQDFFESGVAFVPVYLYGVGEDGEACTEDDVLVQSTGTDADGHYLFECVEMGTYYIQFNATAVEPDYEYTCQDGGADNMDSDAGEDGKTNPFTVGTTDILTIDAGINPICNDVNWGGQICCDQTICAGEVPDVIEGTSAAGGGGSNPVEYLWLCANTPDNPGDMSVWTAIPNSNSEDLQPGPVYQTKYFVRCARRGDCGEFLAESNTVAINIVSCGQMLNFQAEAASNKEVNLIWTIDGDSEANKYFIERSFDGQDFEEIMTINGKNTFNDINTYLLTDVAPKVGKSFYRVKQVSETGNYRYSQVEELMIRLTADQTFSIFPNPARGVLTIENVESFEAQVNVDLMTTTGKILHSMTFDEGTFKQEQVDLKGLPSGTYFVRVIYSNDDVEILKVTKLED